MPKLTEKAIRYGRTDGRTDPNYRKASLLKRLSTKNTHTQLISRNIFRRVTSNPYQPSIVLSCIKVCLKLLILITDNTVYTTDI